MKSKNNSDVIIIGFAVFAMFFGAGNLIFPPFLGKLSGNNWIFSGLGFVITGVGITMAGLYSTALFDGNVDGLALKVGPRFAKVLGTLAILAIGPLFCIPRTAATTYKISIQPLFGNSISTIVLSTVFFSISLYFVLNESTMVDRVGKYLTPGLILMIVFIVVKAILNPNKNFALSTDDNLFLTGFNEGYQTMDALGSMFIGGIACETLVRKGYTDKKEKLSMAFKSLLVAGISLASVYLGLAFSGASLSGVIDATDRTGVLIDTVTMLSGESGKIALAIAMFLACITTSIGLTTTTSNYFSDLTKGKISRRQFAIIITIFSYFVSLAGLERLIAIAVPILMTVYPVIIILMIGLLFERFINDKFYYKGLVTITLAISLTQTLAGLFKENQLLSILNKYIESMPFARIGLPYLVPALICGLVFVIIGKIRVKVEA